MSTMRRAITAATLAGILSVAVPFDAAAEPPDLPDPVPYLPGNVDPQPGSFDYPYNIIEVGPPPTTDSRGVRINTNAAPGQTLNGLPGSQLGNAEQASGSLTSSNAQYGIAVGNTHAPPPNPGISISAGHDSQITLEDPGGLPSAQITGLEPAAPTVDPTLPTVAIEDPYGGQPSTN